MPPKTAKTLRKARKARKGSKTVATLSAPVTRAIKAVVRGQAETKTARFFQSENDGTGTDPATGLFADRGWAVQNDSITSNNLDILQLIPFVSEGVLDHERIGKVIRPVGLNVKGSIRIRRDRIIDVSATTTNIHVYVYALQHVSLKDYTNLRAQNDFNRLLETGEGTTVPFEGNALDGFMAVSDQYYRVLARRKVVLKYAGIVSPTAGTLISSFSVANAHSWYADYTINLSKNIPKRLVYPEDPTSLPATQQNTPTNSSIFMCMGYVNEFVDSPPADVESFMEQTYMSELTYKDT